MKITKPAQKVTEMKVFPFGVSCTNCRCKFEVEKKSELTIKSKLMVSIFGNAEKDGENIVSVYCPSCSYRIGLDEELGDNKVEFLLGNAIYK